MPAPAPALDIPASLIRQVALLADQLTEPLRLFYGESNQPTPDFIKEAAKKALDDNYVFYAPNAGYPDLREAIAAQVAALHGVTLDPSKRVIVTAGGMVGIVLSVLCTLGPGDKALIVTPVWPNLMAAVRLVGAVPVEVPLTFSAAGYRLDLDRLADVIDRRTRLIALASPNNPTGWVADPQTHQALAALADRHDLFLLVDEVYERVYYEDRVAPSILRLTEVADRTFVVNSFSKTYNMTGWRVGWVIAPAPLAAHVAKLQEFIVSHAPSMAQRAALAALREGEPFVAQCQARYRARRDQAVACLRALRGVELAVPRGTFYLFPRLAGLVDSLTFCERLLRCEHVGLAPGSAFGAGGEGHVRWCFAVDEQILLPALYGFQTFLRENAPWETRQPGSDPSASGWTTIATPS